MRALLITAALMALGAARAAPDVSIAYPPDGHRVSYDHVLLEGSVTPGATLSVSGTPASVGPDGLFILWWPLRAGTNDLRLVAVSGGAQATRTLRVVRTLPAAVPTATPTRIAVGSVTPTTDAAWWDAPADPAAERTLVVAFRGSPGGRGTAQVGTLAPVSAREVRAGVYEARLTLSGAEALERAAVRVSLTGRDGRTVSAGAPGRVTVRAGRARVGVFTAPVIGQAINPSTTVAETPDGRPLLYPRSGMTFEVAGAVAGQLRARLAPGVSALIDPANVALLPETAFPPRGTLGSPLVEDPGGAGEWTLRLPLGTRMPFTVTNDGPALRVTLYGTQPDATFAVPAVPGTLSVTRTPDRTTLTLTPEHALWGFAANYDASTADLVLSVRRPPAVDAAQPLAGRVIVLDAGHGGSEFGGAGALRTPEKTLVLDITLRAAEQLRARGADVVLTRSTDERVPLYDRPLLAESLGADLLVSVHANALPDGRDPRGPRGPGVYYTHAQAAPLARAIQARLRAIPGLGDDGLHPGADLALTRPSGQLSVLVETAYLTDPQNLRTLMSDTGRAQLAGAVADGIEDFLRGAP
ncbi:N-acetylmuramoyl-L-alanine amidase [Deinococcus maricopensis]|uniref:Cell wall hydrolase/autolysin n=1 Tax=Deinococcus maricopensis (strain DSM 21211 / LMG 22137 / NRRL B-23946 / LB-34) TaxID=709986 RepID=E8U9Z5_DEIML|nr:N-acetylmuramoyl-L-alanine amidase [Deinococcus maricopensis]ADV67884.1 cell wall hydrolase/autolysin [Deinococcus maricopensis DSM 21211]